MQQPIILRFRRLIASGGGLTSPSAVAYSACVRSHGVPTSPTAATTGKADPQRGQHSQLQLAQRLPAPVPGQQRDAPAASSLRQDESGVCPALVQQALRVGLKFADCTRSHGVPNWPDPTIDSEARSFYIAGAR